jgi:hypothetical protein
MSFKVLGLKLRFMFKVKILGQGLGLPLRFLIFRVYHLDF